MARMGRMISVVEVLIFLGALSFLFINAYDQSGRREMDTITKRAIGTAKAGRTTQEISERLGLSYSRTWEILRKAYDAGDLEFVGLKTTGKTGRPANLYRVYR